MKNNIKKIAYTIGAGVLALPTAVGAIKVGDYVKPTTDTAGVGGLSGTVGDAVRIALGYIMSGIAIISIVGIVIGGLMYVISGGDEEKTKSAKSIIFASIIGLVVALLGYAIVNTVSGLYAENTTTGF